MAALLIYPVSILPAIFIYLWLKKKILADDAHQKLAKPALIHGFLAVIPVLLLGALFSLFTRYVLRVTEEQGILYAFLYNFFTVTLSEELSKGYMLQRLIKKHDIGYTRLDIIVYLVIVAIGFDILESAVYIIGSSPIHVIIRGITLPHLAYGFIMAYFAGKAIQEKNKRLFIPALLIPWVLHGMYDFYLDPALLEQGSLGINLAPLLALADLVIAIRMLFFLKKAKKNEKYTETIK